MIEANKVQYYYFLLLLLMISSLNDNLKTVFNVPENTVALRPEEAWHAVRATVRDHFDAGRTY